MTINHIRNFGLFTVVFIFLSEVAYAQTPADYIWKATGSQSVASVTWDKDQISSFLDGIAQRGPGDVQVTVGDFTFIDLFGDGNLELLATEDYSGRNFFNKLAIVRRTTTTFAEQEIDTADLLSLSGVAADINGDGRKELLVPTQLTPYIGAALPMAKWIDIYSSTGQVFVENSATFSSYYESNILPNLKIALDAAKNANASEMTTALAQVEHDKILRVIDGPNSEVGLDTAKNLAAITDSNLRQWAAAILGDIGTPNAIAILDGLVLDTNPGVAIEAKSAKELALTNAHCSSITIVVNPKDPLHTINLASRKPITVELQLPANSHHVENDGRKAAITFGSVGTEESLIACNNQRKLVCKFRTSLTSLGVGDGVATLKRKLPNGTCIKGVAAVQVINVSDDNDKDDGQ